MKWPRAIWRPMGLEAMPETSPAAQVPTLAPMASGYRGRDGQAEGEGDGERRRARLDYGRRAYAEEEEVERIRGDGREELQDAAQALGALGGPGRRSSSSSGRRRGAPRRRPLRPTSRQNWYLPKSLRRKPASDEIERPAADVEGDDLDDERRADGRAEDDGERLRSPMRPASPMPTRSTVAPEVEARRNDRTAPTTSAEKRFLARRLSATLRYTPERPLNARVTTWRPKTKKTRPPDMSVMAKNRHIAPPGLPRSLRLLPFAGGVELDHKVEDPVLVFAGDLLERQAQLAYLGVLVDGLEPRHLGDGLNGLFHAGQLYRNGEEDFFHQQLGYPLDARHLPRQEQSAAADVVGAAFAYAVVPEIGVDERNLYRPARSDATRTN